MNVPNGRRAGPVGIAERKEVIPEADFAGDPPIKAALSLTFGAPPAGSPVLLLLFAAACVLTLHVASIGWTPRLPRFHRLSHRPSNMNCYSWRS